MYAFNLLFESLLYTSPIKYFRYAVKNNLPALEHVSLPRVGALKVIIDEVGPFSKSPPINGGDMSTIEKKTGEYF